MGDGDHKIFGQAVALHHSGAGDQAAALYMRHLEENPDHARGWYMFGLLALQQGRPDNAAILFGRAIQQDGAPASYHAALGMALKAQGRLREAADALSNAVTRDPETPSPWINLADTLRLLGRFDAAAAALESAIALKPHDAALHHLRGNVLFDAGRWAEAADAFGAAIGIDGGLAEAHADLGLALGRMNRRDEALAAFDSAIRLKPDLAIAHGNRANLLVTLRRFAEADGAYETTLRLEPGLPEFQSCRLANRYYLTTDEAEIPAMAQRYAALLPGSPRLWSPDPAAADRPLRIGYVSGDFAEHPVGIFLEQVLANRDHTAFTLACYSNTRHPDARTERLRTLTDIWHEIVDRGDDEVAALIAGDGIDILVDLSGHTRDNRLPLFALKPAPIQVTWLGYWGTTGLESMDYILSDPITIPVGTERSYSERVWRLDRGRFCYQPPDYAPEPAPPPCLKDGRVTFGSFNNLTKINTDVIGLWADVLKAVPQSRLLLKWTSLADPAVRRGLIRDFAAAGIDAERLELRGPSPHEAMLREYGDIDIALDPFPFCGGLTSCEALWMGVPIVTLPGTAPQSRQTLGFLTSLGETGWAATSPADYVRIARDLAADPDRLADRRRTQRQRMARSPLLDGPGFTRDVETAFRGMWRRWCESEITEPARRTFLHVGCGPRRQNETTAEFARPRWREVRLDIDPGSGADFIASMTDMAPIATGSVDALFSHHNIEHLDFHEVPVALAEFRRVLAADGYVVIACPDLQSVARLIAEDRLTEAAYISPAGPIAPIDMVYGFRPALAEGKHFMAHRTGFTARTLESRLRDAGFANVTIIARGAPIFDLWAIAAKAPLSDADLTLLAARHFPRERL